jgi:uncharacterized membrane protein (DUF441 family)
LKDIKAIKPLSGTAKFFILLIPLILITLFAAVFTDIFITLVFCVLLALVLNPAVDYLESKGINRTIAILLVYVIQGLLQSDRQFIYSQYCDEATSLTSFKEFELDKLRC